MGFLVFLSGESDSPNTLQPTCRLTAPEIRAFREPLYDS